MGRVIICSLEEYDALTDNPTFFFVPTFGFPQEIARGKALLTQLTPRGQSEMLRRIFFNILVWKNLNRLRKVLPSTLQTPLGWTAGCERGLVTPHQCSDSGGREGARPCGPLPGKWKLQKTPQLHVSVLPMCPHAFVHTACSSTFSMSFKQTPIHRHIGKIKVWAAGGFAPPERDRWRAIN